MDPQAAWTEIVSLYSADHSEHWARLEELADAFYGWLHRDGFPPDITGNRDLDRLIAARVCQSIAEWNVCADLRQPLAYSRGFFCYAPRIDSAAFRTEDIVAVHGERPHCVVTSLWQWVDGHHILAPATFTGRERRAKTGISSCRSSIALRFSVTSIMDQGSIERTSNSSCSTLFGRSP